MVRVLSNLACWKQAQPSQEGKTGELLKRRPYGPDDGDGEPMVRSSYAGAKPLVRSTGGPNPAWGGLRKFPADEGCADYDPKVGNIFTNLLNGPKTTRAKAYERNA